MIDTIIKSIAKYKLFKINHKLESYLLLCYTKILFIGCYSYKET